MNQAAAIVPEFNNGSDLEFTDIASEAWREYRFADGSTVRIDNPLKLNVSDSGGHRIFDAQKHTTFPSAGSICPGRQSPVSPISFVEPLNRPVRKRPANTAR
jgi:hypothetical protein